MYLPITHSLNVDTMLGNFIKYKIKTIPAGHPPLLSMYKVLTNYPKINIEIVYHPVIHTYQLLLLKYLYYGNSYIVYKHNI